MNISEFAHTKSYALLPKVSRSLEFPAADSLDIKLLGSPRSEANNKTVFSECVKKYWNIAELSPKIHRNTVCCRFCSMPKYFRNKISLEDLLT